MPDSKPNTALQQPILTADSNSITCQTSLRPSQKPLVVYNTHPYPKPNQTYPHSEAIGHIQTLTHTLNLRLIPTQKLFVIYNNYYTTLTHTLNLPRVRNHQSYTTLIHTLYLATPHSEATSHLYYSIITQPP